MNDPEFIARLQQKDETAFSQLVADWKDRVYNTALGIVQDEADADDITQEVFLAAWRMLGTFRGTSSPGTWLYQIAVRKSVDQLRKMKRRRAYGWIYGFWDGNGRIENDQPDFYHPGVQLEKKQEAAVLFSAIRKLPEQQRIAFSLQKVEGLTVHEIADVLEKNAGAVESLLERAKSNLKKSLANYYKKNRYE